MDLPSIVALASKSASKPEAAEAILRLAQDCFPRYMRETIDELPPELAQGFLKRLDNLSRAGRWTYDEQAVAEALGL